MGKIKNFNQFINEEAETAEPKVKPTTKPSTTPSPTRPNPFRKDKPSVIPKPKAEKEKEVVNKFIKLTKGNKEIHNLLKYKYE